MVGEGAVELKIQRQQRDRIDRTEHGRRGVPGHPVTGVHGHAQRSQIRGVDQRAQKHPVVPEHILVGDCSGGLGHGDRHRIDQVLANGVEPGVRTDRLSAGPAQLDAVVGRRVVAGSEHRARTIELPGGEIQLVGGCQTDAHHVEALRDHPTGEGRGQRRRAVAHVVANHHLPRPLAAHQPRERGADIGAQGFGDLFAYQPSDVISLDDTIDNRGGPRHGGGS